MKRDTLHTMREAAAKGRPLVRAVRLSTAEERLIENFNEPSEFGRTGAEAARTDRSGIAQIGGESWFIEVHNTPLDLRIIGAVHIAQPLGRMAALVDYRVTVIDPRGAFATEDRFPGVLLSRDWPDEAIAKTPLSSRSAVVALTHDPKIDDPALVAALKSDCFYIGALGSKKTHAARIARLKNLGFADEQLGRVRGPVGLAIGARTPAEIAISIVADMTLKLRSQD